MKHEKLIEALDQISDQHIAEAASPKRRRPYWIGAIAAVLALIIASAALTNPLTIQTKAVSLAEYPAYESQYVDVTDIVADSYPFLTNSMKQSLSGSEGQNLVYSPVNLYMALAMLAELSSGSARQQILTLLGADSMETLRAQANDIWNRLYCDADWNITVLASSLWLNKGLRYNQTVMDTLADAYYTSVYQGDLGGEEINQDISDWLNQQTGGLLEDAAGQVSLDPDTVLALYSTVYFQGKWAETFSSEDNTQEQFHAPSGDVPCTFMHRSEAWSSYYWGENYSAVRQNLLDYKMWLILPDEGKSVDDVLSSGEYAQMLLNAHSGFADDWENGAFVKVNLSLPKFDFTCQTELQTSLEALGVTEVFNPEVNSFSDSLPGKSAYLTSASQTTRIAIDEEGVTAASIIDFAAAAGEIPEPEETVDFVLDRPFLFVITSSDSLPLFAGVVNQP